MSIELTREQILGAMQRFDSELRATWGMLHTANNVIVHEQQLYPLRQIISMAARHAPNLPFKEAVACIKQHQFKTLRVKIYASRTSKHGQVLPRPAVKHTSKYRCEREFEDKVIIPLLEHWGDAYQRQYRCRFPTNYGVIDFFVSDKHGTLTLFENKRSIRNVAERQAACEQAKRYAHWYRLPSFVIAAEEGIWVYSLRGNRAKLEKEFSKDADTAEIRTLVIKLRADFEQV